MKQRKTRSRTGLTLIEIVAALFPAFVLLFAAGIVLVYGQRALHHEWRQVDLLRDASLAMQQMRQSIRSATGATLDADGNGIKVEVIRGTSKVDIRFWFVPGQKALLYKIGEEEQRTLLDSVVESASFQIDSVHKNKVTIDLDLQNFDSDAQISSTITMRNYGEGT